MSVLFSNDATLSVDDGASSSFTDVTITKLTLPDQSYDSLDLPTPLGNTVKNVTASPIMTPGELSFDANYNETDFSRLLNLQNVSHSWKVTFPDASYVTYTGILGKIPVSMDSADSTPTMTGTVIITDVGTFTSA